MAFTFNGSPGDPNPPGDGSAQSIAQKQLVELRIISYLLMQILQQTSPSLSVGVSDIDLDNLRADPSLLNQRVS